MAIQDDAQRTLWQVKEFIDQQRAHTFLIGRYYGYPDCCIEEFFQQYMQMKPPEGDRLKACNEGFVPCQKHAEEILAGTLLLPTLITKRLCKTAFPDQGSMKALQKYLRKASS